MAFSTGYTFGFAAVICVVCSMSIAGVSMTLKPKQDLNKERDLQGNILKALGLPEDGSALAGTRIDELWVERVALVVIDPASGETVTAPKGDLNGDGKLDQLDVSLARERVKGTTKTPEIISVYVRKDGDSYGAYAIPLFGKGLWGPISGVLAIDSNAEKVLGTAFDAPKETPGLGAEIMAEAFKQQWIGKRIEGDAGKTKPVRVVKGSAATLCPGEVDFCVDGISGATITSRGVDAMVSDALHLYDPYLARVRGS